MMENASMHADFFMLPPPLRKFIDGPNGRLVFDLKDFILKDVTGKTPTVEAIRVKEVNRHVDPKADHHTALEYVGKQR